MGCRVPICRRDERVRGAGAPRTPRAADPVHVRLARGRAVVVDHVRHVLDVETTLRNVRRHEQRLLAALELLDHPVALFLARVAVHRQR